MMPHEDIPGFDQFDFAAAGISKTVYQTGAGAPVLVLHELPGMTESATKFARR